MIPAIIAAWTFVRANRSWMIPVGIAAVSGVVIGGMWIKITILEAELAKCEATVANDRVVQAENIARAEADVRKRLQHDIELGNQIVAKYAGEIAELQGKNQDAQIALARAQADPAVCNNTPATDAFDAGVSTLWNRAGKAGVLHVDPAGVGDKGVPPPARAGTGR